MIALQRDTYGWDFVFLGANQDAIASAAALGIGGASSLSYNSNSKSTKAAFDSLSRGTHQLREEKTSGKLNAKYLVSDEDREATQV